VAGVTTIAQFVPMLHLGDAVGSHALGLQAALRRHEVRSEIYVEVVDPGTADLCRPVSAYVEGDPADVVVYQLATASGLAPLLAARAESLVVNYHNITPAEHFAPWDNPLARHQVRAVGELHQLATRAALGVAVSEHNRRDLVQAGYAATEVVPPVVASLPRVPSAPALAPAPGAGGGAHLLMVGRLAPNKAVEDAIAALLVYRECVDPRAVLEVVGRPAVPVYAGALRAYAVELGLADAVHFTGAVSDDALAAAYAAADVLVVTSEHEGFCLPVVEAMARGVPVVAYRRGAVPEVLGGAGVELDDKDPLTLARAIEEVVVDERRRAGLVAAGRRRVAELDLDTAGPRLVEILLAQVPVEADAPAEG
jgi:glycosyltransferase involved in cell wall biosynthesis